MDMVESLNKANEEIKKATKYIKIMTQYSPQDSEVENYIFSYEEVVNKYNKLTELIENSSDEYQNPEEADELIYEAANDVICEVQSFYNDIRGFDELEAKLKEEA